METRTICVARGVEEIRINGVFRIGLITFDITTFTQVLFLQRTFTQVVLYELLLLKYKIKVIQSTPSQSNGEGVVLAIVAYSFFIKHLY